MVGQHVSEVQSSRGSSWRFHSAEPSSVVEPAVPLTACPPAVVRAVSDKQARSLAAVPVGLHLLGVLADEQDEQADPNDDDPEGGSDGFDVACHGAFPDRRQQGVEAGEPGGPQQVNVVGSRVLSASLTIRETVPRLLYPSSSAIRSKVIPLTRISMARARR